MARLFSVLGVFLAAIAASLGAGAAAQDATTTRIETRPFYGATVTIEEGVRVFRPLPPHRHIIINPGAKTPLNLTLTDSSDRRADYDGGDGEAVASSGYASNGNASSNGGSSSADFAGGSALSNDGYQSGKGGVYGYKGRRLSGFAPHNVRVNGLHAGQRRVLQAGKSGYGRTVSAPVVGAMTLRQPMGNGSVRSNAVPQRATAMPRVNLANVKVLRPQPGNRSYAPGAVPTQRYAVQAPRAMQTAPAGRMGMGMGKGGMGR